VAEGSASFIDKDAAAERPAFSQNAESLIQTRSMSDLAIYHSLKTSQSSKVDPYGAALTALREAVFTSRSVKVVRKAITSSISASVHTGGCPFLFVSGSSITST
jgi:hypothetical protein